MTPTKDTWTGRYQDALMNTFGAPQMVQASGHGAYLVDEDGKEYLDLLAGIAVNLLGQAHPAVVKAVSAQIATVGHVSNYFATQPQIQLAEKLLSICEPGGAPDGSRVFFTNSGTESLECAIKMIRAHAHAVNANAATEKTRIIAVDHAFHGRSTGALALTWKQDYRAPFAPLMPGVQFVPANDVAALKQAVGPDVAGIVMEPIQGEAGVWPVDAHYLQVARDLATHYDALLVFDEVQSGMGRTGTWMAHHPSGVIPDVMTLAKGLGGGLPIGACIGLGSAGSILTPGMHGTTFGGNPVCAAAGLAVINTIEQEGLIEHAAQLGSQWLAALAQVDGVTDVRGRGLMIGVELASPVAANVVAHAREAGFIVNATGPSTIRLVPPLILTAQQAESFTQALPAIVQQSGKKA